MPHQSAEINTSLVFLFRLRYIRDIVLHPAVDEPGISTLSSMIAFTSTDICIKVGCVCLDIVVVEWNGVSWLVKKKVFKTQLISVMFRNI